MQISKCRLPRAYHVLVVYFLMTSCNKAQSLPTPQPSTVTEKPIVTVHPTATLPTKFPSQTPTQIPNPATPTTLPTIIKITNPVPHLPDGEFIKFTRINMKDGSTGWGMGGIGEMSNHILYTQDGGVTWKDITPPESRDVVSESKVFGFFIDRQTSWVIFDRSLSKFGRIWKTSDAGARWIAVYWDGLTQMPYYQESDFSFLDGKTGFIMLPLEAGMGHHYVRIVMTKNGGESWEIITDPYEGADSEGALPTICFKSGLSFMNSSTGWVVGECGNSGEYFFYQTRDSGVTWRRVNLQAPADAPQLFSDFYILCSPDPPLFVTPNDGYFKLVCKNFKPEHENITIENWLYTTHDSGESWGAAPLPDIQPTGNPISRYGWDYQLYFLDPLIGWVFQHEYDAMFDGSISQTGRLYQTDDGGQTWELIKTPNWMGQFSFVNENTGWAIARNREISELVQSIDGGRTWSQLNPLTHP